MKRLLVKTARLGTGLSLLTSGRMFAQAGGIQGGIDAADTGENPASIEEIIQNVINILLFIVGAASVIMLIIGGIRYVMSSGDQAAVASAKNTILYAIIGIIVAVVAWVLVEFVYSSLLGAG